MTGPPSRLHKGPDDEQEPDQFQGRFGHEIHVGPDKSEDNPEARARHRAAILTRTQTEGTAQGMAEVFKPRTTTEALKLQAGAQRKLATADAIASGDPIGARWNRLEARDMEAYARDLLELAPGEAVIGAGGELVPIRDDAENMPGLVDTVRHPDLVTAKACGARLDLAAEAGSLDMAIDAVDSIKAKNSLERMLGHEIATAHRVAMVFAARATSHSEHANDFNHGNRQFHSVEASRAANAAARMMSAFQDGLLTLQRLRTGGRQVVTVQHVQVNGGQAIVTGPNAHPPRPRGRGAKRK